MYAIGPSGTLADWGVYAYDICTKEQTAFINVGDPDVVNWGMSLGLDGKLYVTSSWGGLGGDITVYRVEPDLSSFSTFYTIPNSDDVSNYTLGVTQDEFGNIYFVVTQDGGRKYNSTENRTRWCFN